MRPSFLRVTAVEPIRWRERLTWSGLILLIGGIMPFLLLWWVASHRPWQPVGSWAVIQAAYTDPFKPFGEMHLCALPPFVLLAVVCLTNAKWLTTPARLPAFVGVNLLLACLPMYFLVRPIRHAYLRHESAIFASMCGAGIGIITAMILPYSFLILHRCFQRRVWPD